MAQPLMPKATAVWLVENTSLTFEQVADFCGMHALEVQAIADGEVAAGIVGLDPVASGQLSREEIERCQRNHSARLRLIQTDLPVPQSRPKGARYTPVSKRQDRPDAIAWLLKHHPELSDAQVCKLVGTTKPTIGAVRDRTHWNAQNIKPRNPVTLGLCSEADLEKAVVISRGRMRSTVPIEEDAPAEREAVDAPEGADDEAEAESQDLDGERLDQADGDADLGDEDADLGDEDADLGDEDADLGDEDADLGDEDADLGDEDVTELR